MPNFNIPYAAQPKQNKFHACNADEVLFGGQAGGGKSEAILGEAITCSVEIPGHKTLILRRTFPELESSLIRRSLEVIPVGLGTYNATKHVWTFPAFGDSIIQFGHLEKESDVRKYQSSEWDVITWDELTHFTEYQYTYMLSRLRTSNLHMRARGRRPRMLAATNPGGVGHAWVKRRWRIQDPAYPPGKVWRPLPTREQPKPGTRCFIPSGLKDNKALTEVDPGYESRLGELPDSVRAALKDGDWTQVEGQAFGEFRQNLHVIPPFPIPPHWKRFRSADYGFNKPFSCHWYAVSPEGRIFAYRELYGPGMKDFEQGEKMVAMSKEEKIVQTTAGHDIFAKSGQTGKSIAEVWNGKGVTPLVQGSLDRHARKMRVHGALSLAPDGLPWLQIFTACPNLIRTLPELITDKNDMEDVDTDGEDHAYDDLSIFLMTRPELQRSAPMTVEKKRQIDAVSAREWESVSKKFDRLKGPRDNTEALAMAGYD